MTSLHRTDGLTSRNLTWQFPVDSNKERRQMNFATRWLALACCVFSVGLMAPEIDEPTKKEYARFEGTWSFDFVEVDGEKQPDAPFETNKTIICKDGRYVVVQGNKITRGIFKLDLTKSPKQYDF